MISFVDLSKIFYPDNVVLDQINFDINDGDFVYITGVSGSGKTTLMKLILAMDTPTEGDVVFDGQSLNMLKKKHIPAHRQKIGVVFQDYKLLADMTVAENIALPLSIIGMKKEETDQRVAELLKLINLEDRAEFFPKQLSGGEAQRVGIARALSTAPAVIFADEPTGNLDVKAASGIIRLLKKINEVGTTVIVNTHDPKLLDIVKNARHLHLREGMVMECEASSEVLLTIDQQKMPVKASQDDDPSNDVAIEGDVAVANEELVDENQDLEVDQSRCEVVAEDLAEPEEIIEEVAVEEIEMEIEPADQTKTKKSKNKKK